MSDDTAQLIADLTAAGATVAVAESLTGGAVCAELIRPAGASAVVVGGIVAYATELKHALLGVDDKLLAEHGPVHAEVAAQMAAGVRRALAADGAAATIGVSTTGVAGPDPQSGQQPGTVFVGLDSDERSTVVPLTLSGDRDGIRAATVAAVIELLSTTINRE
ncbi:nicotinamide-nucleotide amidase [Paramicrobacterium humi]|uniref:Nicotinamide-nucleotide amidase n=1 Tax=Paramicrobacterium humi TaxID=640635 RepID=A0A1H4PS93_9MICO|nr:CinA family protein [Microbacterium humi]SEC10181.1 nicotinamide-nucleotide amidase [Microbacterium humi]